MRELKFRAWDKQSVTYLYFELAAGIPAITGLGDFEQYTGLKDKNGVEIYEGDIVRDDYWGQIERATGQVYWLKDRWVIGKSPKLKTWWEFNSIMGEPSEEDKEIIGNIHEDKELLR